MYSKWDGFFPKKGDVSHFQAIFPSVKPQMNFSHIQEIYTLHFKT